MSPSFTSTASPTDTSRSNGLTIDSSDQGISGGAIAGIVIGVLLALALLVGLVLLFLRSKRSTTRNTPQPFYETDTEMLRGPGAQGFPLQDTSHMQQPAASHDYPPDIKYGYVPETPDNVQQVHHVTELDATPVSAGAPIQRDQLLMRRKEIGSPSSTHPAALRVGGVNGQGMRSLYRPTDRTEEIYEMP